MIGDQYLQIRAQLGTALFSLSTLAHGLHAGKETLQTLHDLRGSLREPFLLLVAGDEKSGRTSLINALFGREVVPVDIPAARDKIHIYKYGPDAQDVPVYEQFLEHYRPEALLRDFNIVDTPASSIITHEHLSIVDRLLPEADVMMFVFSITNPWSSFSLDFLAHLGGKPPRNAVFVLQQCDLRDPLEVDAVAKHLEQRIREKFPEGVRVFPVSAKKAWLSRTTGMDKEGLFQQCGFGALESYISDTAISCEARVAGLRKACESGQAILAELAEKTRATHALIKRDIEILAELNLDLEERRAQAIRQVGGVQWAVAQTYERMQKRGEEILMQKWKRPGVPKGSSTDGKLQPPIDAKLEDSILRQIQHALELMEEDLEQMWPQLHETTRTRFPAGSEATQPSDLINERTQMLQYIEASIMEKKPPAWFKQQEPALFEAITAWLHIPQEAVKQEGIGAFAPPLTRIAIADFYHALAAATEMQGKFSALGKGPKIIAQFRTEMAYKREELLTTLEGHLRQATDHFHKGPFAAFQPMQSFFSRQLMIYEPRIALAKQMEESLGKTAVALGLQARPVVQLSAAE